MSPARCTKCCCGIPLKTGAFILGWLIMVLNVIQLSITVINVYSLSTLLERQQLTEEKTDLIRYILYAVMFIYGCEMIMTVNLLLGLHKGQRFQMEKFCKAYPVLMFLCFLSFLAVFCINFKNYTLIDWLYHLADTVILIFQLYTVFIVVLSSKEMKEEELTQLTIVGADIADGVEMYEISDDSISSPTKNINDDV